MMGALKTTECLSRAGLNCEFWPEAIAVPILSACELSEELLQARRGRACH